METIQTRALNFILASRVYAARVQPTPIKMKPRHISLRFVKTIYDAVQASSSRKIPKLPRERASLAQTTHFKRRRTIAGHRVARNLCATLGMGCMENQIPRKANARSVPPPRTKRKNHTAMCASRVRVAPEACVATKLQQQH